MLLSFSHEQNICLTYLLFKLGAKSCLTISRRWSHEVLQSVSSFASLLVTSSQSTCVTAISHLRLDAIHLAYSTEMNEPTQMVQTYIYYGYFVLVMNKLCTHRHVYFHETLLRQHWFCKCLKKNLQKIRFFFVLVSDEIFLFAPVRKGITHNASTTNTLCQNTTLYFSRALY